MEFQKINMDDIEKLAKLASSIWHEYWPCILSSEQIDYMVDKFQSEHAINNQIKYEDYLYYIIKNDDDVCGYFGISTFHKDYLFLSKLYLKSEYRHLGIGKKSVEFIKQIALDLGYEKIQLTVNKHNTNTINAYLKYGFITIDKVVTDIGNNFVMDDYIMEYKI